MAERNKERESMKANARFKAIKDDNKAYAKAVGGLVALLIIIIVGIMVYWSISDGINPNLTYTNSNNASNAQINTSVSGADTTATTIFNLLPIIAIVVVGGILIGLVIAFGGGKK